MNPILKKFVPHIISLAIFFGLAAVLSMPALQGKMIHAHDTSQHKGMSKEIADHREAFQEEALWTNRMFGGMPAYQISMLYPKNLIKKVDILLRAGLPHPAFLIFKTLIGFYLLLLILKTPWKFAIAGAIAFALSTYFIIIIEAGHNSKANAIAYIAPSIAGIILIFRQKYLVGGVIAALFLSLQLVANHFQVTFYMGISLFIYGIVELIIGIKNGKIKETLISGSVAVAALLLAIGVNNTNLRLTQDYLPHTQRGKSELAIKKELAKKKAEAAEKKRQELITAAKADKTKEFNPADFLPEKEAYATNWSYGIGESMTLAVPNIRGGGSADYNKDSKVYKLYKNYFNNHPQYGKMPKKERLKIAGKQTGNSMYWGRQPGVNGPVYIGAGVILLFFLGMVLVKSHLKWWLLGTVAMGLFISWGKNFLPFFQLMFDYFPFYDGFRAVTIAMILVEFAAPLLGFLFIKELMTGEINKEHAFKHFKWIAGSVLGVFAILLLFGTSMLSFETGAEDPQLIGDLLKDRKAIFRSDVLRSFGFALVTAIAVLALIKGWMKTQYIAIGLAVASLADLWVVDSRYLNEDKYVKSKQALKPFDMTQASSKIIDKPDEFRVFNISQGVGGAINDASTAYYHNDIGGYSSVKLMIYQDLLDFSLREEMNAIHNTVTSMKKQLGAISPPYMNQFLQGPNSNIVNMLNTKYIIHHPNQAPYENPNAFGNAWLVKNVKYFDSPDSVMFSLHKTNLRETAITQNEALKGKSFGNDGSIEMTDYKANHLSYEYKSGTPSLAVFSEIYFKDWNAYVDGKKVDIFKSNYVLRSVELPAGEHKVELKFEPHFYIQGENISLASSTLLLGLLLFVGFKEVKKLKVEGEEEKVG